MTLHILGSSSAGNGYLFVANDGILLLEMGIHPREVKTAVKWQISRIVGGLVSHSHGDHAKYISDYLSMGIDTYCHADTLTDLNIANHFAHAVEFGQRFSVGPFSIMAIKQVHDVTCAGYIIHHREMGTAVFATDTEYLPQIVKGCNHLLIECNYADDILESNIDRGFVPAGMRPRLLHSHLEESNTMKAIANHAGPALNTIVLLHLSSNNSDAERFLNKAQSIAAVPTYIASSNLQIELTK